MSTNTFEKVPSEEEEAAKKSCCSGCCCSGCCRLEFKNKRSPHDTEIVKLFLQKRKYGLPGSDGTLFSNWWRYVSNHDPLLAIIFTHRMNTYGRFKRLMMQVCIVGFTLYMNIWSSSGNSPAWVGVIISIIILQPVQLILDQLASVADPPCCLDIFRCCTDIFFYAIAFAFAFVFWLIGGLSLETLSNDPSVRTALVGNIFLSVSAAKVQILDIPNWIVEDWRNVPFLCGFDSEFGIFDLFLFKCLCGPKTEKKESSITNDGEKKRGCCASCCSCCCSANLCCGMFTQAGFWFMIGMAVGFPTSTYAHDKDWFQNHPMTKDQPSYRKGAVRVDDPDLLVLEGAIQIVIAKSAPRSLHSLVPLPLPSDRPKQPLPSSPFPALSASLPVVQRFSPLSRRRPSAMIAFLCSRTA